MSDKAVIYHAEELLEGLGLAVSSGHAPFLRVSIFSFQVVYKQQCNKIILAFVKHCTRIFDLGLVKTKAVKLQVNQ